MTYEELVKKLNDDAVESDLFDEEEEEWLSMIIDALEKQISNKPAKEKAPPVTATLKLALDTYGAEAQTLVAFEEMAELEKELCKHARGRDNRDAIAEEIADVLIMLEQMMLLHDCKDAVADFRRRKIKRLAERLKEEKDEKDIT